MESINNPFQACKMLFLKPNPVFATIKAKHNWSWIPFLLVCIANILPALLYFDMVDMQWYQTTIANAIQGEMSPAEKRMLEQSMDTESIASYTILGTIFGLITSNAILAGYLYFMTKSDEQLVWGFTNWFGFGWWLALPTAITSVFAALIILLFGGSEMSPVMMSSTSLAFLLGIGFDEPNFTLFQAIRFENFWMIYLTIVGLMHWTSLSYKKTVVIATTPYILLWILMALMF